VKPTKLWSLASYAFASAIFAFVLAEILVTRGFSVPLSPINLPIAIASVAVALGVLAIPMARYRKALKDPKKPAKRLAPTYAFRVVVLAKASALSATLFFGWHIGILVAQLTLPAITANIVYTIVGIATSVITVVVALVVENLFKIPPDIEEPTEGAAA
jgi:hypothetical protein